MVSRLIYILSGFLLLSFLAGCGSGPTVTQAPAMTVPPVSATDLPPSPIPTVPPMPTVAQAAAPEETISPEPAGSSPAVTYVIQEYPVPSGSHPHDVAPAPDGTVWYTAQRSGELGRLDPATGETHHIPLGAGSAPHGVIVGPDGATWVTDSGLNAIVRVDPQTEAVQVFPLPDGSPNANLNTAAFDGRGVLWFTGQNGV